MVGVEEGKGRIGRKAEGQGGGEDVGEVRRRQGVGWRGGTLQLLSMWPERPHRWPWMGSRQSRAMWSEAKQRKQAMGGLLNLGGAGFCRGKWPGERRASLNDWPRRVMAALGSRAEPVMSSASLSCNVSSWGRGSRGGREGLAVVESVSTL